MHKDKISGLAIATTGLLAVGTASQLPAPVTGSAGSALFPTVIGGLMALVGLGIFVSSRTAAAQPAPDSLPWYRRQETFIPVAAVFLAVPAFILVSPRLGFLLTMTLVIGGIMAAFRVRWLYIAVVPALASLAIHLAFAVGFRVQLPWGLIEEILPWI